MNVQIVRGNWEEKTKKKSIFECLNHTILVAIDEVFYFSKYTQRQDTNKNLGFD